MNAETAKKALMVRTCLDSPDRDFVPSELAENTFVREFTFMEHAKQIHFFSESEVGDLSEAHILFAVRTLGAATKQQVADFLAVYKSKNPGLSILDTYYSIAGLEGRLANLKKYGYLYSISYTSRKKPSRRGGDMDHTVTLYLISEAGVYLMNNVLGKRIACDRYSETSPLAVILAKASVALQATQLMKSQFFSNVLEGIFRDRWVGAWYLPCELKFDVDGDLYYVMFHYGFMLRDERRQTEDDFNTVNFDKVRLMKQYLFRRTKKGKANVVVTVLDNDDLMDVGYLFYDNIELIGEYLDQIYFTGEGVSRMLSSSKDRFLQLEITGDKQEPVNFVASTPPYA